MHRKFSQLEHILSAMYDRDNTCCLKGYHSLMCIRLLQGTLFTGRISISDTFQQMYIYLTINTSKSVESTFNNTNCFFPSCCIENVAVMHTSA